MTENTDMIGTRFYKDAPLTPELEQQSYEVAMWCNSNGAELVDHGDYVEVEYSAIPDQGEVLFASLREERDKRLLNTDCMLLSDYPITSEAKKAVKSYRKELRDLPAQPGAPWDGGGPETPWPVMPEV